jgi:hypothetical protein
MRTTAELLRFICSQGIENWIVDVTCRYNTPLLMLSLNSAISSPSS